MNLSYALRLIKAFLDLLVLWQKNHTFFSKADKVAPVLLLLQASYSYIMNGPLL